MSIEGHRQAHFLTLFFQVLYILCLYEAQISGERLQDHWSSGLFHALAIAPNSRERVARSEGSR